MSVSDGLLQRCRDAMIPEPITFTTEARFAGELPTCALIDVRAGIIYGPRMDVDEGKGLVTITADGRSATYVRRGITLNGAWVCDLVQST